MRSIAMWFALAAFLSPVSVEAQNTIPATTQVKITHADGTQVTLTVKKGETPALAEGDQVTSVDGPAVTFIAPGGDKVTAQSGSSFKVETIAATSVFARIKIVSTGGVVSVSDSFNRTHTLASGSSVEVAYYDPVTVASIGEMAYIGEHVKQDAANPASSKVP